MSKCTLNKEGRDNMKAKEIMNKDVITVSPEDTVTNLVKLMLDKSISGVPVVDEEQRILGIVSETDLIYPEKSLHLPAFIPILDSFVFIEGFRETEKEIRKMSAYKVEDVMTKDVITINEDQDIQDVVNLMIDKRINRIPVIDKDKKVIGIITRSNILKHIY